MKLVVDANILFSFFKRKSFTRNFILNHPEIEYLLPVYVFDELDKHKDIIMEKAGIDNKVYELIVKELKDFVEILDIESFEDEWKRAKEICPDPDDVHYFAVAMSEDCPLWTNDQKLSEQEEVKVIDTGELVKLFGER